MENKFGAYSHQSIFYNTNEETRQKTHLRTHASDEVNIAVATLALIGASLLGDESRQNLDGNEHHTHRVHEVDVPSRSAICGERN